MDDETIIAALGRWMQTVDKCIREQEELIQKMSGHIIDLQVDITALVRHIEHIEEYINPMKDIIPKEEKDVSSITINP